MTTFAVYVAHDMTAPVSGGVLASLRSPRIVSTLFVRMPRSYFVWSWTILAAVVASGLAFATGSFSLTGVETVVFVLIFGWISLFVRFLGVAGQHPAKQDAAPRADPTSAGRSRGEA
ncbi:hypothetical protein DEA06_04175 [Microbacterium sp. Gd 4-13]|uniref:hypothetical protein n=1 Tax=Microbacterium sp. Gd 4-13 TaxID=2173179 RepID=UPI000D587D2B|nr:hypothetical protein [Microbacterium sp. Gd 4-13]PVW06702.1 hypothetical protein DEA06_04175 [Microbacterium sp. Gd 4-13]